MLDLSQLGWLVVFWCVEVDAVPTVSAVYHVGSHGALAPGVVNLAHASPLPRVLLRIREEDVVSVDVQAPVVLVSLLVVVLRQMSTEDPLAVVRPKV